jgi:hypothetical protein
VLHATSISSVNIEEATKPVTFWGKMGNNLLTPCSRVLLEKLSGLQLVKKFPAFYGSLLLEDPS